MDNQDLAIRFELLADDDVAQLLTLPDNVTDLFIERRELQLPALPAHVKVLTLWKVKLLGQVVMAEGLQRLELSECSSDLPINEWMLPASLTTLEVAASEFDSLDLSDLSVKMLVLYKQYTASWKTKLPASLKALTIINGWYAKLPTLPASLETLEIDSCGALSDFSSAREVKIVSLSVSRMSASDLALYDNFSELRELVINEVEDRFPEISLTHLRRLKFRNCGFRLPIEVNAPNLETLLLEDSAVEVRGDLSGVTSVIMDNHSSLPEVDGWDSLTSVELEYVSEWPVAKLPHIPRLKRLVLKPLEGEEIIETNGVRVSNLREYKEAWSFTSRKKGGYSAQA